MSAHLDSARENGIIERSVAFLHFAGHGRFMRRHRPTKLDRLLLATLVLVGTIGSSPTFSHAHGRPDSSHDAHFDHHDHDHGPLDSRSDHDHEDSVSIDDSVSHLHGVLLGIPFALPTAPGEEGSRPGLLPFSEACLTPTATADADHFAAKALPWPDVWGLASSPCAHRGPSAPALHAALSPYGTISPCALLTRSVMLRC
jgi:hypothetical protein